MCNIRIEYAELPPEMRRRLDAVEGVLMLAAAQGFVVSVEQRPLEPLAMGNYETVISARPLRELATPIVRDADKCQFCGIATDSPCDVPPADYCASIVGAAQ